MYRHKQFMVLVLMPASNLEQQGVTLINNKPQQNTIARESSACISWDVLCFPLYWLYCIWGPLYDDCLLYITGSMYQCYFTRKWMYSEVSWEHNKMFLMFMVHFVWSHFALQWRHNERDGVSNHKPHDCLLNRLFKVQIKANIKAPRHWPLWGEFTGDRWIHRTNGQ